jgi:regulatory protein spx
MRGGLKMNETIYVYMGHYGVSEKKAVQWFNEHELSFDFIYKKELTTKIMIKILSLTDAGFDSVIVFHSNATLVYKRILAKKKRDYLTSGEMIQLILEYPRLLRSPIIFDDHRLLIGFNEEEIRQFLPRLRRNSSSKNGLDYQIEH